MDFRPQTHSGQGATGESSASESKKKSMRGGVGIERRGGRAGFDTGLLHAQKVSWVRKALDSHTTRGDASLSHTAPPRQLLPARTSTSTSTNNSSSISTSTSTSTALIRSAAAWQARWAESPRAAGTVSCHAWRGCIHGSPRVCDTQDQNEHKAKREQLVYNS